MCSQLHRLRTAVLAKQGTHKIHAGIQLGRALLQACATSSQITASRRAHLLAPDLGV